MNNQQGQTLIETIVAAFILTMVIGAALGLANYSLNISTNIRQQTVAMGLAREGIEVVKNIRDTNWLNARLRANCYNYETAENNAYCYPQWMNPPSGGQNIKPQGGWQTYVIRFDPAQPQPWRLEPSTTYFGLTASPGGGDGASQLFYDSTNSVLAAQATSGFGRMITIEEATFYPFNQNNSSRLKVTSQVWWSGKNCPASNVVVNNSPCLITLETYLTNWKNFQ